MPGHAYKGKGGQSPCQAERRPGVTCLGTERYHMNPDALDAYITGNYGAGQFADMPDEKDNDRLYNDAFKAVEAYARLWRTSKDAERVADEVMELLIDLT